MGLRAVLALRPHVERRATRGGSRANRLPQLACALAVSLAVVASISAGNGQEVGKADPTKGNTEAKLEPGLEGSWKGGGEVAFAVTGSRERARCRAHYVRKTKDSYSMNATCATASGKAAQIATVHRVGENRYRGNFHNPDYDISGTIFVVVNGNSQSVRLTSTSGSALFRLTR
jgi:hypothetical protein